ncbi:MAG: hypothetical protein ABH833_02055, partial [Parcubacteria group bacterium]
REQTRILTEQVNMPLHQKKDGDEIIKPLDTKPKIRFDGDKISFLDTDMELPAFLRQQNK